MATGDRGALATFRAALGSVGVQAESSAYVSISGLRPADLDRVLFLVNREGLTAKSEGQKLLVRSVSDRLCAWE